MLVSCVVIFNEFLFFFSFAYAGAHKNPKNEQNGKFYVDFYRDMKIAQITTARKSVIHLYTYIIVCNNNNDVMSFVFTSFELMTIPSLGLEVELTTNEFTYVTLRG